jgi:hypothetical protein
LGLERLKELHPEAIAPVTSSLLTANQVNLDKLCLKRFYSLTIPKSVIHCRHDKALPPGYFHPRMSSRLGTFKLVEMDGSHEVMFTRAEELADKIIEESFG